jgi:hypothetical protein
MTCSCNFKRFERVKLSRVVADMPPAWPQQPTHVAAVKSYCKWLRRRGVPYELRRTPTGEYLVKGITL